MTGRSGWWASATAALILGAAACGGTPPPDTMTAPDGLRPARGYAAYELCNSTSSGACSGAVPAGLRRPLHLPHLAAGAGCRASPAGPTTRFVGQVAGAGPVYPVLGDPAGLRFVYPPPPSGPANFAGSNWGGVKVLWVAAARYRGPVLIRGRQLDGPHAVGFGGSRVPIDELQLLSAGAISPGEPAGWREWPSYARLRAGGCYAFQVDGTNFSRLIVFRAVAQH